MLPGGVGDRDADALLPLQSKLTSGLAAGTVE